MQKPQAAFSEKWSEMHYLVLAGKIKAPAATAGDLWQTICDATRRDVAIGQVYAAIDRLERFGCVTTKLREIPPDERAPRGRKTRDITLTPTGREVLRRSPLAQMLADVNL
jgi:DNA-binding PadR family transcriptional regulator